MIDKKPIEELIADCKKYWPAFPIVTQTADRQNFVHWGMSLRDYFAGQAIAGIIANEGGSLPGNNVKLQVRDAYEIADAMLAEREK